MDQEPEVSQEPELSAASRRSLEIAVALFLFLLGLVVLADSWRIGSSWAEDGPQAGYFPPYIGLIICITSLINFYKAFRMRDSSSFVSRQSLGLVLTVLLPTVVYVALIS